VWPERGTGSRALARSPALDSVMPCCAAAIRIPRLPSHVVQSVRKRVPPAMFPVLRAPAHPSPPGPVPYQSVHYLRHPPTKIRHREGPINPDCSQSTRSLSCYFLAPSRALSKPQSLPFHIATACRPGRCGRHGRPGRGPTPRPGRPAKEEKKSFHLPPLSLLPSVPVLPVRPPMEGGFRVGWTGGPRLVLPRPCRVGCMCMSVHACMLSWVRRVSRVCSLPARHSFHLCPPREIGASQA
jgi:hypothetical protein